MLCEVGNIINGEVEVNRTRRTLFKSLGKHTTRVGTNTVHIQLLILVQYTVRSIDDVIANSPHFLDIFLAVCFKNSN